MPQGCKTQSAAGHDLCVAAFADRNSVAHKPAVKRLTMKEYERNTAYDYLRVLASFGVIILHIAAKKFLSLSVYSNEWQVLNFYDSIVRWTVPVFVMISGALFLNRDIPIRKL